MITEKAALLTMSRMTTWGAGYLEPVSMGDTQEKRTADMREAKADGQPLLAAGAPRTTGELLSAKDACHANRRVGLRNNHHVRKQGA